MTERRADAPAASEDPLERFADALARAVWRAPETGNACALATADRSGAPSVRMVRLEAIDAGGFVIFTNLLSRKAQELRANPQAALVFHWVEVGEQVRIEGGVEAVDEADAATFFGRQARLSQIAAWASEQSEVLASRSLLHERVSTLVRAFDGRDVPCPPHWGGIRVVPRRIEFWSTEAHQLHTRELFTCEAGRWTPSLLFP